MPRQKRSKQKVDSYEESESSIKASVGVGRSRLEMNIVHGVHDGLAFWRWWNKFQEADGVASGEKHQQNRGDAVEPGGFHGRYLGSCSAKFFCAAI